MKLNVPERLLLLAVLPDKSDYLTLKVVKDVKDALGFSEDELKSYGITQEGTNVNWNPDKTDEVKDIPIGEAAFSVIADSLKKLSDKKELLMEHLTLYDKFQK